MPASRTTGSPFAAAVAAVWLTAAGGVAALSIDLPNWAVRIVLLGGAAAATAVLARHLGRSVQRTAIARLDDHIEHALGPLGTPPPYDSGPPDESLSAQADRIARRIDELAGWAGGLLAEERDRAELAEALFASVGEPVLALDAEGIVIAANPAFEDSFGVGLSSTGRSIEEIFTQRDLLRVHARTIAGEQVQERVRAALPRGVRVLDVTSAPALEDSGAVAAVLITLRDVTELARAVQLKTDFVANASHELRTPLASISASVETLTDFGNDDPALREKLTRVIGVNASRLREMVEDLLDLSRLESPDSLVVRRRFPISTLPETLVPMYQPICAELGLTLRFSIAPELVELDSDRKLVLLVIKNLLENATKFAHTGTEVTVKIRLMREPAQAAPSDSVAGLTYGVPAPPATGPGVLIEVRDRGQGIPIEHQKRIFERFYQVDQARTGGSRRGTGLGLAIVKHAVRALGGSVRVESVWQRGTTFSVELPGAAVVAPGAPASPSPAPAE